MSAPVSELFMAIVDFAAANDAPKPLSAQPGLWKKTFGPEGEWEVRMNGHPAMVDNVPEFHAMVFRHGLPVGIVNPFTGTMLGDTEDAAIDALRAEMQS